MLDSTILEKFDITTTELVFTYSCSFKTTSLTLQNSSSSFVYVSLRSGSKGEIILLDASTITPSIVGTWSSVSTSH